MKLIKIAVVLAVLLLVAGGGVLFWMSGDDESKPVSFEVEDPPAKPDGSAHPGGALPGNLAPAPKSQQEAATWDERIGTIIADQALSTDEAAVALMDVARNAIVPDDQRLEAIEHAFNLLPDEIYREQVMALVNSGQATADQLEGIIFDLHDRDGRAQLETALDIAQTKASPIAEEAFELMEFLVDPEEELGRDWGQWRGAVEAHLAQNE